MTAGNFGLDNELKIKKSGVRKIFTPHSPVNDIEHFFGREDEASRFVSVINTPGQHVLVYGDRGVGKTSLSVTTCKILLHQIMRGGRYIEKRCDSQDDFQSIVRKAFDTLGIEYSTKELSSTTSRGGDASLAIAFAKAGLQSKTESRITKSLIVSLDSPSWVADQLRHKSGILLIDEVDAITDNGDKQKLAELVKLLSDYLSEFKVVIVGIAATGASLTAGHPSVQRCLKEVWLKRMTDDDVKKIIVNGFKRASLVPAGEVVDRIVDISAGLPHFAHLICLKCAEYSIVNGVRHITEDVLRIGLNEAVKDSENVLKESHDKCLKRFIKQNEYRVLLIGAAHCKNVDFKSDDIRANIRHRLKVDIGSTIITRRLNNLAKADESGLLVKSGRACFRFKDPRMPSYLKMLPEERIS
ncbi:MAG: nSTAND1 domain-containing NTPase [Pseudomarimonas sp.]